MAALTPHLRYEYTVLTAELGSHEVKVIALQLNRPTVSGVFNCTSELIFSKVSQDILDLFYITLTFFSQVIL